MSFWEGFARGWKDVQDRNERREILLKEEKDKRAENLSRLGPALAKVRERNKEMKHQLSYLKSRGVSDEAMGVFSNDPKALSTAYTKLTTDENWSGLSGDALNSKLQVTLTADTPDGDTTVDWETRFNEGDELYSQFSTPEALEGGEVTAELTRKTKDFIYSTPTPTGTVVFEEPKTLSSTDIQKYKAQVEVYDSLVLEAAQHAADATSDKAAKATLTKDIESYGKNPSSTNKLRSIYGGLALDGIKGGKTSLDQSFFVGLDRNPFINSFIYQPKTKEELLNIPTGTEYLSPNGEVLTKSW